jgi:UDP-N-acetylglucosamine acyltransferase
MSNIHPTAIIEEGAILGDNISVGPYTYIGKHVTIGDHTQIDSHTLIDGYTTIGKHNHIFSHAAIGSVPQDLKYNGEKVELIIGDHNTIREFTLLNPGTKGGGSVTKVGDHNLLMGYVHLGHDVIMGDHCILANGATLAGHVELGDHVVIGGLSAVHQFVHIGEYAMLGGASALAHDLPPYCMAQGNRAKLKGLNATGLRRKIEREEINALNRAYKALFKENRPLKEVAQELLETNPIEKVKYLCKFIKTSKRGISFKREENKEEE